MWKKLKYCFSHSMLFLPSLKQIYGSSKSLSLRGICCKLRTMELRKNLRFFGFLDYIVLIAALCLGLYIRWAHSQDMAVLLIAFMGLVIFAVTGALVYYFSMESIGVSVARLWIGCLLGVISFPEADIYTNELLQNVHEAMNILLVTSLILRAAWIFMKRILHLVKPQTRLISRMDALEMVGMATSSLVVGKDFLSISLLVLALALTITAIRTRSFLGLINLLFLIIMTTVVFFPKLLSVPANPCALLLFLGRVALHPVADLYFSSLNTLERWEPLLRKSKLTQRLLILIIIIFQLMFFIVHAKQMPNHKEWFVVVPLFAAFGFIWVCYHLVFLVMCWQLSAKIAECNLTYRGLEEEARNMNRIMAAKGVRHFSLISQRLVLVTLLSTIVLAGIGWQTKTALSVSLWMIMLPIEICVLSALYEMGGSLGGTCVGYAVVAPAIYRKTMQSTTVLPAGSIEVLGSRATTLLNTIQRFFSHHLIDTFGCDFSSNGLTADAISAKLKAFFQMTTKDGPRYDTYMVYYSGPVHENGDWALAGNERLTFNGVMEWWHEADCRSGARIIFVLDTEHSFKWHRLVRQLQHDVIGVQSCMLGGQPDPEVIDHIGDFTSEWVDYNSANLNGVNFHNKDRSLRAAYAVSKSWTDFTFHLPTDQDINQHWGANFPRVTKPLIKVTNFPKVGRMFCCCDCVVRCLKRKRMMWLPPLECDTGHGFKLIRT